MANAMRCDRCGKFYMENERFRGRNICKDGFIGGVTTCTADSYNEDATYDLCDDCIEALYIFLDNKSFVAGGLEKGGNDNDKN